MQEVAFVAPMGEGLDLYGQPYDARYPVIGIDEQSPNRGWAETRTLQPHAAGTARHL